MNQVDRLTRRRLLALSASALTLRAATAPTKNKVAVGLELYSVRDQLTQDLFGTLTAVARMGYEAVEFYAPYFLWSPVQAKQVRRHLDDLGMRCSSTHNGEDSFTAEGLKKAVELNQILGSRYIMMAGSGPISTLAGWKALGERITKFMEKLTPVGMSSGFHNHESEWTRLPEGMRPMDVLAATTPKEFVLQLDVGTCVAASQDPVAWIRANPGRTKSVHCKDWAHWPWGGYRVLFGDGGCPWAKIFEAAESVGGVETYLIEQEGSHYTPFEAARRCLETYKRMRG